MRAKITPVQYQHLSVLFTRISNFDKYISSDPKTLVYHLLKSIGVCTEDQDPENTLPYLTDTQIDVIFALYQRSSGFALDYKISKKDLMLITGRLTRIADFENLCHLAILEFDNHLNRIRVHPYNAEHEAQLEEQIKQAQSAPQVTPKKVGKPSYTSSSSSSSSNLFNPEPGKSKKRKHSIALSPQNHEDQTAAQNEINSEATAPSSSSLPRIAINEVDDASTQTDLSIPVTHVQGTAIEHYRRELEEKLVDEQAQFKQTNDFLKNQQSLEKLEYERRIAKLEEELAQKDLFIQFYKGHVESLSALYIRSFPYMPLQPTLMTSNQNSASLTTTLAQNPFLQSRLQPSQPVMHQPAQDPLLQPSHFLPTQGVSTQLLVWMQQQRPPLSLDHSEQINSHISEVNKPSKPS